MSWTDTYRSLKTSSLMLTGFFISNNYLRTPLTSSLLVGALPIAQVALKIFIHSKALVPLQYENKVSHAVVYLPIIINSFAKGPNSISMSNFGLLTALVGGVSLALDSLIRRYQNSNYVLVTPYEPEQN